MASVASQVVFHPLVSQGLKMGSTTVGRDKTYRTVQYFSRFLAWYLLSRGNKLDAARWSALKSHLGMARKLLRLGKPMEHLQAALSASIAPGPAAEQVVTIGRQLGYFGYLTLDAFVWANGIKFITLEPETAKKISRISNRFWLAGILFSITNAILKTVRLTSESKKLQVSSTRTEKDLGEEVERETKLRALAAALKATHYQFYIDILDVWNPATSLGFVGFNDGVISVFGFISSILAWRKQWLAINGKK